MTADRRARNLVIANIVALASALIGLVWNAAVMTTEFNAVKREQERQALVQAAVVVEQARIGGRLDAGERARTLLDGRIMRLENLQLGFTR